MSTIQGHVSCSTVLICSVDVVAVVLKTCLVLAAVTERNCPFMSLLGVEWQHAVCECLTGVLCGC